MKKVISLDYYEIELTHINEVVFEFKVWGTGQQHGNDGVKTIYIDYNSVTYERVEDRSMAKPYFEGTVKWDGCMDITLNENHFCGKSDWASFNNVISTIYKYCEENMEYTDLE